MDKYNEGFILGTISAVCSIHRNAVGFNPKFVIREILGGANITKEELEQVKGDLFDGDYEIICRYSTWEEL